MAEDALDVFRAGAGGGEHGAAGVTGAVGR